MAQIIAEISKAVFMMASLADRLFQAHRGPAVISLVSFEGLSYNSRRFVRAQ